MIEEVRELLQKQNFASAAIVDDAYDELPSTDELTPTDWNRFFDDISAEQEARLKTAYGEANYAAHPTPVALGRDQKFVEVVWSMRDQLGAPGEAVFADFDQRRETKRGALEGLTRLLVDDLKIPTQTFGRAEDTDLEKAQIIFLDLFLGPDNDKDAVKRSIARIRRVIAKRKANPPVVFLMSASPHLAELAPDVRDEAELLGCQFRTFKKSTLADQSATLQMIYDLIVGYPDSQKINSFILAWDASLTQSHAKFLREIRTMDLADYANLHGLILEAEEQKLGDYVVDLYDLYLHNLVEGHDQLIRAAKGLNAIDWSVYPARQFMPSEVVMDMMDGSLFHNEERTELEGKLDGDPAAIRFGDVFLSPCPEASDAEGSQTLAEAVEPATKPGSEIPQTRRAYVVLSQPCDLMRDGVDAALLLRGTASKYEWEWHQGKKRASAVKTPIMMSGGDKLAIDWSPLTPHTWEMAGLAEMLATSGLKRARRFRLAFALQLQRQFLDGAGRIGTPADLPGYFDAAISVFFRTEEGKARQMLHLAAGSQNAVCLAGRTKKEPLDWLLLSEQVVSTIVDAMKDFPETDVPRHERTKFAEAIKKRHAFSRLMKGKLPVARGGAALKKPLTGTAFDIVEISTTPRLSDGKDIGASGPAILIDLDLR